MGLTKTYKDGTTPTVCIIGAGFSGLCAAIRLQTELNLFSYQIFELEPELGGTWWANTYPGCACDVKSINYQFTFEPNYEWSRAFAGQKEIWEYMRRTAQKHDLYKKISFRTEVTKVQWEDSLQKWSITHKNLNTGEITETKADIVFSGMGPLRIPKIPEEFSAFKGPKWHTAQWNHDYDLTGKRVAIVGSGASAIQIVPSIVDKVKTLDYYQRSPTYLIPRSNGRNNAFWLGLYKYVPFAYHINYKFEYYVHEVRLLAFSTKFRHKIARYGLQFYAWAFRYWHIRDKALRKKLTPQYEMGCRRIAVASDYYPAVAKSHVQIHTEGIQSIQPNGIVLKDGSTQEFDAMILATGFQVQDMLPQNLVFGKDGVDLSKSWGHDPVTFYGISSDLAPNLFFLLGPNTTLGHNSVLHMIEAQVDYAIRGISYMMENDIASLQVTPKACKEFLDEVDKKMAGMVWSTDCRSWYQNENGKVTALWWGTCSQYWSRLRKFRPENFTSILRSQYSAAV
ncbi:hypothetical protein BGW38_001027 [Lunasporangiospora selenospora]|uniref:Cyclohexanone monooxygenase n=1 Tax=Lunasporangiospora selenospora TaxID=979761 RepID=A0A9P6KHI2_9FUNG|nr:hypothetical protein BGW38_001027 [Lunasporangiospora selenospora]